MRTFIAIDLPQEIKEELARLQALLKKSGADVKWVTPKNIHLTLKFLGEISEDTCAKIASVIEGVAAKTAPFAISLASLGAFPKIQFPRVIWVALSNGDKETQLLAENLENSLEKLGIPKEERAFSSHITIGRLRSPLNKDKLIEALKKAESYFSGKNLGFTADKITLFKSLLGPGGPVYEPLKETSLTAN